MLHRLGRIPGITLVAPAWRAVLTVLRKATSRRSALALGLGLVFLFCAIITLQIPARASGPLYRGLPLNYWKGAVVQYATEGKSRSLTDPLVKAAGLREDSGKPAIFSGDPAAVPVLIALLKERDSSINISVYDAMCRIMARASSRNGKFTRSEFIHALTHQLGDKNGETRGLVFELLRDNWQSAVPEVVSALTGLLQDEEPMVRLASVRLLGKIGPDAALAVPSLLALQEDPMVKPEVAEALVGIDPLGVKR